MKAMICKTLGGPADLTLEDIAEPFAEPGHVVVRVKAVGLNFADTLITRGKYQFKPDLPFSPGAEISGIVETIGSGVTGWRPGDRVMAYVNWGGAREKLSLAATALVSVPDGISDAVAAGLSVTYGTAMHGLLERGCLTAGEIIVVTGASGGAGQAAVEVATALGAHVIAVASSPDKLAVAAKHGARHGIVFPGCDLKQSVRDLTGGVGADLVYDCVGGDASEPLVRALAWKGRFLVVGFASGDIAKIPLNLLLLKGAEISGVFWGEAVRRDPARHVQNMETVLRWIEDGILRPTTPTLFALDEMPAALDLLDRRKATGKLVVTM